MAGGRPRKEFDLADVEKLAALQCTYAEMAAFFGCNTETVERRMKNDDEFCATYKKGFDRGKTSLRRLQWRSAESGNVTMQIWLGKQYLEQSDKQELTGKDGGPLTVKLEGELGEWAK